MKNKLSKKNYNYGKCHVCGEQMQEKRINQDFWLKGKLLVIESVPAGVCPQCGEKVVNADVGRDVANLIQNLKRQPKRKTITVPCFATRRKLLSSRRRDCDSRSFPQDHPTNFSEGDR
jgi:YgiT-type zinc finger domain-containing protein